MQFRLSTLLLLFVVLWSSLAVFGSVFGIIIFTLFLALSVSIARSRNILFGILVLLLLHALLWPAVSTPHEVVRRATCCNNMKQLVLALRNYQQANGSFPPAYITDKNGRPMHSWRVLILPFLGAGSLYQK